MNPRVYVEHTVEPAIRPATIGVVIPVYNRQSILLETLPFVLAQSRRPHHLVIADDGSTDGTPDAAEAWLRDARPAFDWRVLRLPHRTSAHARAQAYRSLGGVDYVAFLDSDDHWPVDFLERTAAALDANPDASVALVDRRYTDLQGPSGGFRDGAPLAADPVPQLFRYGAGVASCTLLRSAGYESVGGWDPSLESAEDTMLFVTMALEGSWVHVIGEPVDYYLGTALARGEENNLSRRYAYSSLRWARVHELVLDRVRRRRPDIDDRPLRRSIARLWYIAGKELMSLGRAHGARRCFARSVKWNAVQYHGWRRLLTA
ncbi:glycosyltransferase family A protein [Botrimarina mediterranea]|uniref:Glycosyltransferase EpsE n=1 Tax=Botrimarina mediterranea TaxID=2528022 RepID=A0A518K217_9BACT|nr:glycosyltransferase family A protein [Botrimarina mediterranea]QDV71853.1 Putative glycosyltransferase EpsE [Botrimarina mediterranea]QDV76444.1 Putative glycosyltransferase EpsE [Planctomycetes bacterium K2D]